MKRIVLVLLAALMPAAVMAAPAPLEVIHANPAGEDVPASRQLVFQFNRAVVPLGRMARDAAEIPVTITPPLACEWRWINPSALACNLPESAPMQLATRYAVEMNPGIAAEDGGQLAGSFRHIFVTQRPQVNYSEFRQWKSPSLPVLRLVFNQPVDRASVEAHVFFRAGDGGQRVALSAQSDPMDYETPLLLAVPGEKAVAVTDGAKRASDDQLQQNGARRIWLVEPVRELPADSHIILASEAGLTSPLGKEAGVEGRDVVAFDTYPAFRFLGVRCRMNNGTPLFIPAGEAPKDKCNPMQPVQLSFSVPVTRKQAGRVLRFTPPVGGWGPQEEAEDEYEGGGELSYEYRRPHEKGRGYDLWLPAGLKAAQRYEVHSSAEDLHWWETLWRWLRSWFGEVEPVEVTDIFGRRLAGPLHTAFETGHRPPNVVLAYTDAVLEKGVDSEVPLFVNNLESYRFNYRAVSVSGTKDNQQYHKDVPQVQDVQFAVPLGVREMLAGQSGALFGRLATTPPVRDGYARRLFAQVTPYQVHMKLGHFSSLAWVTDMATGKPVEGAKLAIIKQSFTGLALPAKGVAESVTDASGVAALPGTEALDPDLSVLSHYRESEPHFFLHVAKGGDMALLPLTYHFSINSYRASGSEGIWPANKERYGHMQSWGMTAQGIYRAGDTIQYKLYVRNQDDGGFIPPPREGYGLKILDPMGKVAHEVKSVTLSEFGGYAGEFTVPKNAPVGWYQFKLVARFAQRSDSDPYEPEEAPEMGPDGRALEKPDADAAKKTFRPMRVLVSDFTPATFRVASQLNGDRFSSGQQVEVKTQAKLHSGGPYTNASARVTAVLDSAVFAPKHPVARDFVFDSFVGETPSQQIFQDVGKVDDKGELALGFSTGTPNVVFGRLMVESAVADDRGKYISTQARADYVGLDRLVGLKSTAWLYEAGKPVTIPYLVVDAQGDPAGGTEVTLVAERQESKSARVKGAGNAYLSEYYTEWVKAGGCKGVSALEPQECRFTPEKAGLYRIRAEIQDTKGRVHGTTLSLYVTGGDYVAWADESDTALSIVPEKNDYKVGDVARFMVKNPYPGAEALVTVERYGVVDHFTQTFGSSTPVVELPIKPDYLPGFYLSVVVTSPRVEKPLGEGQVDLGKPAMRMGYVSVAVKDPYKEMAVTASTDKEVYKPREKVTLSLHAAPRMPGGKEKTEFAVAVLDEAVFDLVAGGRGYFDPYGGFYTLEGLDLRNYSLLTRLVGRQKFEKKGANPGGDGGADLSMRSLFKFVSYWNPSLTPDKDGNATVSFDAPDNLTGWRVLAMAVTPSDRFGLGEASFKVNRPTEVQPAMPNQVLEGDVFDAAFSVMNRTDKERKLSVALTVEGNADAGKAPLSFSKELTLAPFAREVVSMPVAASAVAENMEEGVLRFTAHAGDAEDEDAVAHALPVRKRRSLEVATSYGTTTENEVREAISFPEGMLTDVGSVSVVAAPSVIGNLAGAFSYMRDYPYTCWEQMLSKAVMASHFGQLKAYLPSHLEWPDAKSLPQNVLNNAASFQAPNGGMAYFLPQDAYVDPYLSAYTALAFTWLREAGYDVPGAVEAKLHNYLQGLLKNDAVPDFYSAGMTSTVRAVALSALSAQGKVTAEDMGRYWPHVKRMTLFGKSHFLQAALRVEGAEQYIPELRDMILANGNETGGKYLLNESWDDSYTRILATPLRDNCAVLDAFSALASRKEAEALSGVPFKLVRGITQSRAGRDHFENTQENLFCLRALIDYAKAYEQTPPGMTVTAALDGEAFGKAVFKDVRDAAATLSRKVREGDAGRKAEVTITREGAGRLYYATRIAYAMPVEKTADTNAGIELHREYSVERGGKWELLTPTDGKAAVARGELVRVDLYLSVPAARNFVVVDDAVPGGLEPVNRDLATASVVDARKGDFAAAGGSYWFTYSDWQQFGVSRWSFYHRELRHDSARFYADYLPPGNYHLSYTAQAVATGAFSVMPALAQEMYDPDVYGKTAGLRLSVGAKAE